VRSGCGCSTCPGLGTNSDSVVMTHRPPHPLILRAPKTDGVRAPVTPPASFSPRFAEVLYPDSGRRLPRRGYELCSVCLTFQPWLSWLRGSGNPGGAPVATSALVHCRSSGRGQDSGTRPSPPPPTQRGGGATAGGCRGAICGANWGCVVRLTASAGARCVTAGAGRGVGQCPALSWQSKAPE
jgi:hypothetical protein